MGYYHIKNIKMDKKNNTISGDLADSNWTPIEYKHYEDFCCGNTFEEKYANFIYNVVSGNYHPMVSNKYYKIMMNSLLSNYYNDAHDIGELETYNKYKDVINGILNNNATKCIWLESDRTLNPEHYYVLIPIDIDNKYKDAGKFYTNEKGELFCLTNKELMICDNSDKDYGYPFHYVYEEEKEKFEIYNSFLQKSDEGELQI